MYARDYRRIARENLTGKWGIAILVTLLVSVLEGALSSTLIGTIIFVGPLAVGTAIVFSRFTRKQNAEIGDLFGAFKSGALGNAILGGVLVTVYTFLWTLLFVIPGIIKTYSYSMTFYILADNPGMDANEAITASRKMMNGNKWRLFCLHFSFIGWVILSMFTFGILLIVYVAPYMEAANAAFYESIKEKDAPAKIAEGPEAI